MSHGDSVSIVPISDTLDHSIYIKKNLFLLVSFIHIIAKDALISKDKLLNVVNRSRDIKEVPVDYKEPVNCYLDILYSVHGHILMASLIPVLVIKSTPKSEAIVQGPLCHL